MSPLSVLNTKIAEFAGFEQYSRGAELCIHSNTLTEAARKTRHAAGHAPPAEILVFCSLRDQRHLRNDAISANRTGGHNAKSMDLCIT